MPGEAVIEQVQKQLAELRNQSPEDLSKLPDYSEVKIKLDGRRHWLGIWKEQKPAGTVLIVVQCRDPAEAGKKRSYVRSYVKGFYVDGDAGNPMAHDDELKSYA